MQVYGTGTATFEACRFRSSAPPFPSGLQPAMPALVHLGGLGTALLLRTSFNGSDCEVGPMDDPLSANVTLEDTPCIVGTDSTAAGGTSAGTPPPAEPAPDANATDAATPPVSAPSADADAPIDPLAGTVFAGLAQEDEPAAPEDEPDAPDNRFQPIVDDYLGGDDNFTGGDDDYSFAPTGEGVGGVDTAVPGALICLASPPEAAAVTAFLLCNLAT